MHFGNLETMNKTDTVPMHTESIIDKLHCDNAFQLLYMFLDYSGKTVAEPITY